MLTIEDLRNPNRKSGFDHVNGPKVDRRSGRTNPKPFQAAHGAKAHYPGEKTNIWTGTRRATAEEAAQDYCDYVNSGQVGTPATLNTVGHSRRPKEELDPEVEAALGVLRDAKAQRAGRPGFLYCIGESALGGYGVKVGYSVNPEARVGELQTGNPRQLHLLAKVRGTREDERALHAKYIQYNLIGEWFIPTPELLNEFGLNSVGQPYGERIVA